MLSLSLLLLLVLVVSPPYRTRKRHYFIFSFSISSWDRWNYFSQVLGSVPQCPVMTILEWWRLPTRTAAHHLVSQYRSASVVLQAWVPPVVACGHLSNSLIRCPSPHLAPSFQRQVVDFREEFQLNLNFFLTVVELAHYVWSFLNPAILIMWTEKLLCEFQCEPFSVRLAFWYYLAGQNLSSTPIHILFEGS